VAFGMTLNIIVAHKPEAQGLINGLSMVRDRDYPNHAVYAGANVKLGICGTGYQRCRAMTEILKCGLPPSSSPDADGQFDFWLNYGTAGSSEFKAGELIIADSVIYPSMSRQWGLDNFPVFFSCSALNQARVCTVDNVEETYKGSSVYEMEAAGMLSVLEEAGCLQRALVLKLVSDGPEVPIKDQTRKQMIELLDQSVPRVQLLVDALLKLTIENITQSAMSLNEVC
jgi:hypothetical protein